MNLQEMVFYNATFFNILKTKNVNRRVEQGRQTPFDRLWHTVTISVAKTAQH